MSPSLTTEHHSLLKCAPNMCGQSREYKQLIHQIVGLSDACILNNFGGNSYGARFHKSAHRSFIIRVGNQRSCQILLLVMLQPSIQHFASFGSIQCQVLAGTIFVVTPSIILTNQRLADSLFAHILNITSATAMQMLVKTLCSGPFHWGLLQRKSGLKWE